MIRPRTASNTCAASGRCEPLQIGLERLHCELRAEELLDDGRQVTEDRGRAEIVLPVLRDEEIGPQIDVRRGRLDTLPKP